MDKRKTKKFHINYAKGEKVLLRTNVGKGISGWKITNTGDGYIDLLCELNQVREKSSSERNPDYWKMSTIYYVLDPEAKKLYRAKSCSINSMIHHKERKPIVLTASTEITIKAHGEFFTFRADSKLSNDDQSGQKCVFYPFKETIHQMTSVEV